MIWKPQQQPDGLPQPKPSERLFLSRSPLGLHYFIKLIERGFTLFNLSTAVEIVHIRILEDKLYCGFTGREGFRLIQASTGELEELLQENPKLDAHMVPYILGGRDKYKRMEVLCTTLEELNRDLSWNGKAVQPLLPERPKIRIVICDIRDFNPLLH